VAVWHRIRIADITKENWYETAQLRVSEEQTEIYPVPVVYWLAESKFETHFCPKAIYKDDEMIGFLVYCLDPDDGNYWLTTFMIDEKHQGNGYAKQAISVFLTYMKEKYGADKIKLGHRPENAAAASLYEKMGFHDTGERIGGEIIRCYRFQ